MDNPRDASVDVSASDVVKVAIVDDDLFVRSTLVDLLSRQHGIEVLGVFADGAEAVMGVIEARPDVVLVDVSMPGMDGIETTRRIKAAHSKIQVLALTSFTDERTVSGMLRAGAVGFLFKDTPVEAMGQAIRSAKQGLSVLSPQVSRRLAANAPVEDAPPLTELENRILQLVCKGLTNDQIAAEVYLSSSTVKYHVGILTQRLTATNRVTLAVRAGQLGLL